MAYEQGRTIIKCADGRTREIKYPDHTRDEFTLISEEVSKRFVVEYAKARIDGVENDRRDIAMCRHPSLKFDKNYGPRGMWCCSVCELRLDAHVVRDSMSQHFLRPRQTHEGNLLADECQMLKDGNHALLVENAQLRRELDQVKRKSKK